MLLRHRPKPTPMVNRLTIVPKKTVQLKSFAIAVKPHVSNIFNDTLTS